MGEPERSAFTVLGAAGARVLAVRPVPRPPPAAAHSLLDPKFSRALDFKLRRLKEKEILQANLRRPTAFRPRDAAPDVTLHAPARSRPRLDVALPPADDKKPSPKMDKSPSPGRGSRVRKVSGSNDGDKPRFVTTVKTGQFLLPPPELACLLGLETLYPAPERERIVYSYANRPKAVATRRKRAAAAPEEQTPPPPPQPAGGARAVFGGVRALAAGVAGMQRLLEQRDQPGAMAPYANMMHEKRIVRGTTFAAHPHAAGDGAESAAARAARTRRRAMARRAAAARLRPGSPPPAPGRRHLPVQTEYYLEELFDKGVELEVGVQTDLFVDRPASPVYVPAKTGADAGTQIYPGDLFDFDLEVQPILETLVGKTTEQALAEVAQEEELATLRETQRRHRELRRAHAAERQRLRARDQRLHDEKERRVAEAAAAQIAGVEARSRAAAATLVEGYIANLIPSVLAGLRAQGLLRPPEDLAAGTLEPWLRREVAAELGHMLTSRDLVTEVVREVVEARALRLAAAPEEHQEEEELSTPPSEIEPEQEEEAE